MSMNKYIPPGEVSVCRLARCVLGDWGTLLLEMACRFALQSSLGVGGVMSNMTAKAGVG